MTKSKGTTSKQKASTKKTVAKKDVTKTTSSKKSQPKKSEAKKPDDKKTKKVLGGSIYSTSKKKKSTKNTANPISKKKAALVGRDRQIKLKIKHLQREVSRITESATNAIADGDKYKKLLLEKTGLETKIKNLKRVWDKFAEYERKNSKK